MQEEVNQKTVALSIRTTKLTGKVLAAALGKVVRALQKHHRKALTPQGRQSVKKLMNHYGGKNAMQYVGAPKDFDRIAKEFHVDYAFHKVSPVHYLLFFKANQADAITAACQKYSAKVLNKEQDKPSFTASLVRCFSFACVLICSVNFRSWPRMEGLSCSLFSTFALYFWKAAVMASA